MDQKRGRNTCTYFPAVTTPKQAGTHVHVHCTFMYMSYPVIVKDLYSVLVKTIRVVNSHHSNHNTHSEAHIIYSTHGTCMPLKRRVLEVTKPPFMPAVFWYMCTEAHQSCTAGKDIHVKLLQGV